MEIAWPERLAFGIFGLICAGTLFVALFALMAGGQYEHDHATLGFFVEAIIRVTLLFGLPIWLLARIIDLAFDGPGRRKRRGIMVPRL